MSALPEDWFEFDVVNRQFDLVRQSFVGTPCVERIKLVRLDGADDPNQSENLRRGYERVITESGAEIGI